MQLSCFNMALVPLLCGNSYFSDAELLTRVQMLFWNAWFSLSLIWSTTCTPHSILRFLCKKKKKVFKSFCKILKALSVV